MKKILFVCFFVSLFILPAPLTFAAEETIQWYNTEDWGIEGRGWTEGMPTHFGRIPTKAQGVIPDPVWYLAKQSSGLVVRFKTNSTKILVEHKVTNALAMPHMTAVGTSGLDLYNREADGKWYWAGFSKPTTNEYMMPILEGASSKEREYMLYLPLYNITESLSIGVPEGFSFEPVEPMDKKPIFYYGTSIAHGCSSSRPGMNFVAMIGRRFDRPAINFAFSGSGRMEEEMAELIAEVDAEVYVVDCLPNMTLQLVQERTEIFIRKLRQLRPDTPIVLVEDRTLSNARLLPWWEANHKNKREAFQSVYDKLTAEGMRGLSYLKGDTLLGTDEEGTIDGSHPNDLGMVRMADSLEPVLRKAMER